MRKGFSVTLATVAFAALSAQTMAMAPTIGDIPDIIVGEGPDATSASNVFVFPDAVNLSDYVSDDDTTPGQIVWSYSVAGTAIYNINGVAPLDLGTEDRVAPGSKSIDDQDLDPAQVDSNPRTITVRNVAISPIGSGPNPEPSFHAGTGVSTLGDSQVVTLHASDGTTASSHSIIVYTEDEGTDRLSPSEEIVYQPEPLGTAGWTFALNSGTVTQSSSAATGLCLTVADAGSNDGQWMSPYAAFQLAANSAYEARVNVNTTQTTPGEQPIWMLVYDNYTADASAGKNEYGGEIFILDNEGGANSAISGTGRSEFTFYMMPAQMQVPYFNSSTTGFFRPDMEGDNDFRVIFRIFDRDSVPGTNLDDGTICMTDITIVRHDLSAMNVVSTDYSQSTFSTTGSGADRIHLEVAGPGPHPTLVPNASGVLLQVTPPASGFADTVTLVAPGDGSVAFTIDPTAAQANVDDWPVPITGDTLYYVEYELSAPTTADAQSPPDALRIGADVMTLELVTDHFVSPNTENTAGATLAERFMGISMPRTGGPYKYACFFYSLSESFSGIPTAKRMRPRFEFIASPNLNPFLRNNPEGDIQIHSVKVQEVTFP